MNSLRLFTAKLPLLHTSIRHYYLKPKPSSSDRSQSLFLAAGVVTGLLGCSVYFLGKCCYCCCCCYYYYYYYYYYSLIREAR